jgi:hypothetical protein
VICSDWGFPRSRVIRGDVDVPTVPCCPGLLLEEVLLYTVLYSTWMDFFEKHSWKVR